MFTLIHKMLCALDWPSTWNLKLARGLHGEIELFAPFKQLSV